MDVCESLDWVDGLDRISLPLDQRAIVELNPLEEYQSSISIDFDHVYHCFIMFYDHLKGRNIQMDRHWIWFDGCVGQFKMHAYFNGCVHCIKTTKFHIYGTILRLGMVKESMMEP